MPNEIKKPKIPEEVSKRVAEVSQNYQLNFTQESFDEFLTELYGIGCRSRDLKQMVELFNQYRVGIGGIQKLNFSQVKKIWEERLGFN